MWGWVSQAYYDVVARVVPGAALIFTALFIKHGPERGVAHVLELLCRPDQPVLCRLTVGLVISYFVGLILGGFGELLGDRMLKRTEWTLGRELKKGCLDDHNKAQATMGNPPLDIVADEMPSTVMMRSQLNLVDASEASYLLKLGAERRLCQVMVLGLSVLAAMHAFILVRNPFVGRFWLEIALVGFAIVLWQRSTLLYLRLTKSTCCAWLMSLTLGRFAGPAA